MPGEVFDLDVVDSVEADAAAPAGDLPTVASTRVYTDQEIDELEICPTPPALALAICKYVQNLGVMHPSIGLAAIAPNIIEPSAGEGAFVSALREVWPYSTIVAVELRPECETTLKVNGAKIVVTARLEEWLETAEGKATTRSADIVVGNPPFSLAEKHIRMLLNQMKPGAILAFLLRLAFYESFERVEFWKQHPEDGFAPIVPRPGFKLNKKGKKGTDSQAYGLFIWTAGEPVGDHAVLTIPRRLPHILWRDAKAAKAKNPRKPRVRKSEAPNETTGPAIDLE